MIFRVTLVKWIILLGILATSNVLAFFGPRRISPTIRVKKGNIFIESTKNISLQADGSVNIQGRDLTAVIRMLELVGPRLNNLNGGMMYNLDIRSEIRALRDVLNGNDGVLARLTRLEAVIKAANVNDSSTETLESVSRKVYALEKRVSALRRSLTHDNCVSNPCMNGATCEDKYNGFVCRCQPGWEGPRCDMDINECARYNDSDLGCQNGATCSNTPGSYQCWCTPGFFGKNCNTRSNDCNLASSRNLCDHGTCVNQQSKTGFKCICDQGWTTDPATGACSVDVNECVGRSPPCSVDPLVPCINVPGSFVCGSCPAGFTGTGYYCVDIDECLVNNGGCSTAPSVQCINTRGSRRCGPCPPGYQGNGEVCSLVGVCTVNNGGCHAMAFCLPSLGQTPICVCKRGYEGNGFGPNGCVPSQTQATGLCSSNPCSNGGTCFDLGTEFSCNCPPSFTGPTCSVRFSPCMSNPCRNNGTCIEENPSTFRCECPEGFTGRTCRQQQEACGGYINQQSGELRFPLNARQYPHGVNCGWVITTNSSFVLNVTFLDFHLEGSRNCNFDWLQIHDGASSGDHQIGRYCGTTKPGGGNIISTHNTLYLWFRSDSSISRDGFRLRWESINPVCGSTIDLVSHASISSPGAPGKYPANRDCVWILKARPGNRIHLSFFSLQIESHPNCSYDFLDIRSHEEPYTLLGRYCNSSHPPPLITPGNEVEIRFHSDARGQDTGFQIAASVVIGTPGCGGMITSPRGQIQPAMQDDHYLPRLDCTWIILLPTKERIKVMMTKFFLEHSSACTLDFLELRDGADSSAPSYGRFCGTEAPATFITNGNSLFVHFHTDPSINREGFILTYESICGGTFTSPNGTITSPFYPSQYPHYKRCIYQIDVQPNQVISLAFDDFELERSVRCILDYVEIRDGNNENSTLVGRYCGNDKPEVVRSVSNSLYITFRTDSSASGRGFKANYAAIDLECGGVLKASTGIIESPRGSNGKYRNNEVCTWIIVAPRSHTIKLNWLNFHLEASRDCKFDAVSIFDNYTMSNGGQLAGTYCGRSTPPPYTSLENVVTITFSTDSSLSGDGFALSYIMVDSSRACGGNYTLSSGVLRSPNYPKRYPDGRDCIYLLRVTEGRQIRVNFTDFELESSRTCSADHLEIRNGGHDKAPLIGRFCGINYPPSFISFTNELYIHFVSDHSVGGLGFSMKWDSALTGCGGSATSSSGSITSPNYPQPYGKNAECIWSISTNLGSKLRVVFVDLDMEDSTNCGLDYIELWSGLPGRGKKVGRYCTTPPEPLTTSENHLYIKFHSDGSFGGRGFRIDYSTVCSTQLTARQGIIESPGYPQISWDRCHWVIAAPKGSRVNVTFIALNSPPGFRFSPWDFHRRWPSEIAGPFSSRLYTPMFMLRFNQTQSKLELKEASGSAEPTTTLYTLSFEFGEKITMPAMISSSKDHLHVSFNDVSSPITRGGAFRLEWVVDGCGGEFRQPQGSFSTPNYPKAYPHNIECTWAIKVDPGYSIRLFIEDINIERSLGCVFDSLTVFGGADETAPVLTQICHSTRENITLTSSSNEMILRFESDSSYDSTGFRASYDIIPAYCGGRMTTSQGTIHSRNYPQNYDPKDDCTWIIEVDPSHVIRFDIRELDLIGDSTNCTRTYLALYDGESADSPELLKVCGNEAPPNTTVSTGNVLRVRMKADGASSTAKGFIANYTMGCGARIVTSGSGVLETSGAASITATNPNCSWIIISEDPSKHVTLTFSYLMVTSQEVKNGECEESNRIDIHEGMDSSGPLIGRYCEGYVPLPITSRGSALFVHLVSPNQMFHGWFTATYSVLSSYCGGTLRAASGTFASPRYPDSYPSNMDCEWTLAAAPGNRVQVGFRSFSLTNSFSCNADFVEIRKNGPAGEMIGVYCGDTIPTNLTASNVLWIKFRSSNTTTGQGFVADYSYVHGNLELGPPSGSIASPLYPMPFYGSETSAWRILVSVSKRIQLNFKVFIMDRYTDGCARSSVLQVFDGFDETATRILEACGNDLPDAITSSSNALFIRYQSPWSRLGSKFLIEYLEVTPNVTDVEKEGNVTLISLSSGEKSSITSPGYPEGYAENLNVVWVVETTPGSHIQLVFETLDLETDYYTDYVTVYSGKRGPGKWELIGRYNSPSATQLRNITAGVAMKVVFTSDSSYNRTGFDAILYAACGGEMYGPSGVISLSNSSQYLRFLSVNTPINEFSCEWVIKVPSGKTIDAEITYLDIPSLSSADRAKNRCGDSYLQLRSGVDATSVIGRYCSGTHHVNTSSNVLYVKFQPGGLKSQFQLKYQQMSTNCMNDISLSSQLPFAVISSPNYPNVPPPFTECIWRVSVPPAERVSLNFLDRFDLTRSAGCKTAAVEVRDGGSENANMISRFCRDMPGTVKSSGSMLYIRFYTDTADPKNGFKANVSIDECGGTIRGYTGVLSSPNYPLNYHRNLNCQWKLIVPELHTMKVSFAAFEVGDGFEPCSDTLTIVSMDPEEDNSISSDSWVSFNNQPGNETLGTFCGPRIPGNVTSSTNAVLVTLRSSAESRGYKGFLLSFGSEYQRCGGMLEALTGSFQSLGYPNRVYKDSCYWTIRVPRDRRVTLYLDDFDLSSDLSPSGNARQRILLYIESDETKLYWTSFNFSSTVREVDTGSSAVYVVFHSYLSSANRGVRMRYDGLKPTICGGPLSREPTELKGPANFSVYSCRWTWDEPSNSTESKTLAVYVRGVFNNRYMFPCSKIMANVFMGLGSTELYRVCTNEASPPILVSPYAGTHISMTQGRFEKSSNLTLTYSWSNCGGVLKSPSELNSPNFPFEYPSNTDCAWAITFDEGERITFSSVTFDLASGDYLRIYNGPNAKSLMLGEYTGNTGIPETISSKHRLWVVFHSDSTNQKMGFKLRFESVSLACGQDFHDSTGEFTTPGYPLSYTNNLRCNWTIHCQDGFHIGLTFEGRFNVEQSSSCSKDYIEVFDKRGNKWESLGKVCGRNYPVPFNSTGTSMRVVFHSDDSGTNEGFKARWNLNCGQEIVNSSQGYIVSPGYPMGYPANMNCTYVVRYPEKHIAVKFEDFSLESGKWVLPTRNDIFGYHVFIEEFQPLGKRCQFDNVTLRFLTSLTDSWRFLNWDASETRGPYCGETIPPPFRAVGFFSLNFRSDGWVQRKGFKLKYTINECNDNITSPTEISSPGENEDNYFDNLRCTWHVSAPPGQMVMIKLTKLKLETSWSCSNDRLAIYNGTEIRDENLVQSICGKTSSEDALIKAGQNAVIQFITDGSVSAGGFKASVYFATPCDKVIHLRKNEETSAVSLSKYQPNQECHFKITTEPNFNLRVTFDSLVTRNNCSYGVGRTCECRREFVEMRDDSTKFGDVIGRYCRGSLPTVITTSDNGLWIRSSTTGEPNGVLTFATKIKSVPSICGSPVMTNVSGTVIQTISSLNYPRLPPPNLRCSWTVSSPSNSGNILLSFQDINLDGALPCDTMKSVGNSDLAYVEIYREFLYDRVYPSPAMSRTQLIFCGNQKPPALTQQVGKYRVVYHSGSNPKAHALRMSITDVGCSGNYTDSSGFLLLVKSAPCVNYIKAPSADQTIAIYFNQFAMYSLDESCSVSALEILEGSSPSSPRLAKICGYELPPPVFSNSSSVTIRLLSTVPDSFHHIAITYIASDAGMGCGGYLRDYQGTFTSPMYPQNYRKPASFCVWTIEAHGALVPLIKFATFDLGNKETCSTDYIEIFDVDENGLESFRVRYCGGDTPAVFRGNYHRVTLKYTSSVHNTGQGWHLRYKTVGTGDAPSSVFDDYFLSHL